MTDRPRRVLIGGVGYRNLRDHSVPGEVIDRLAARPWPDGVEVEDLSYNPVAVAQRLDDELKSQAFDRVIFIGAVSRGRRPIGSISVYRWDGELPSAERVQAAVAEAITGVIALDNTLIVCRQLGALPSDVVVIEVEPKTEEFGDAFTPEVGAAVERVCELALRLASDDDVVSRVPLSSLGGGALPRMTAP